MYQAGLKLFRSVREETLRLAGALTESQAAHSPGRNRWSAGEVLDHLLLSEALYRERFAALIELARSGQKPELYSGFSEVDTSILFIPKAALPLLEFPFRVMNYFLPAMARETLTRYALLPAQAPGRAQPRRGKPLAVLRQELQTSLAQTEGLFAANPNLDYRAMRLAHPLIGDNNVLQLLRIMALHEQRHQDQIRALRSTSAFPKPTGTNSGLP
ncbi:MAG TPA: DinB family protein [Terriglobia bacterium]|nr:DinB family protein [Terriglobia bacterium]